MCSNKHDVSVQPGAWAFQSIPKSFIMSHTKSLGVSKIHSHMHVYCFCLENLFYVFYYIILGNSIVYEIAACKILDKTGYFHIVNTVAWIFKQPGYTCTKVNAGTGLDLFPCIYIWTVVHSYLYSFPHFSRHILKHISLLVIILY